MVEQTVKNTSNAASGAGHSAGHGTGPGVGSSATSAGTRPPAPKPALQQAQDIAGQALSAGRDLKDKVSDFAESSAEAVKAQAAEFADTAKEFASQAGETLKDRAYSQKNAGADYVFNIAGAIRRAAHEFDADLPIAGVYLRKAASRVEDISDTVQHGDIQDLVQGVQSFARRQPTAFLGLAVLAGFGAVRFLKSSARTSDDATYGEQASSGETRGYRDEFTK
jgi:hypothetical protein